MANNLARSVNSQTDRKLRQLDMGKFYGETIEYAAAIAYAAGGMTVTFANKYTQVPCAFAFPRCTMVFNQEAETDYYIGATITPTDVATTYNFAAICSGKVTV